MRSFPQSVAHLKRKRSRFPRGYLGIFRNRKNPVRRGFSFAVCRFDDQAVLHGFAVRIHLHHETEDLVDARLRVTIEHARIFPVEQRIIDPGIPCPLSALAHEYRLRLPDLKHGHTGNRARRVFLGRRIDDVVGSDNDDNVQFGESPG